MVADKRFALLIQGYEPSVITPSLIRIIVNPFLKMSLFYPFVVPYILEWLLDALHFCVYRITKGYEIFLLYSLCYHTASTVIVNPEAS